MKTLSDADLGDWATQLPSWLQEALRRLLESGDLEESDYVELVRLSKRPYVTGPSEKAPELSLTLTPKAESGTSPVALLSISNIANAGALAQGPVQFSPVGLSVLYGDNGCGKSSLTRILKRLCRSLAAGGPILRNINNGEATAPAQATVEYLVQRTDASDSTDSELTETVIWVDGESSDGHLASVNVFDAECARAQVGSENDISYKPAILKVFEQLVQACTEVTERLRVERKELGPCRPEISELELSPDTPAGKYLAGLSGTSDKEILSALCDLSAAELQQLEDLQGALRESPLERAQLLERRISRISGIAESILRLSELVSDQELERHSTELADWKIASKAAVTARATLAGSSVLPGTGSEVWRELWESARRYSERAAYREQNFPPTYDQTRCVLCQQQLESEAVARLQSFHEFVTSDTQQAADAAKAAYQKRTSELKELKLPVFKKVLRDLEPIETVMRKELRLFLIYARLRRRHILSELEGPPPVLPKCPDLSAVIGQLQQEVTRLQNAADIDQRDELLKLKRQLEDRQSLRRVKEALLREIDRIQANDVIEHAIADCSSRGLTRKAGEVAKVIVAGNLHEQFMNNVRRLNFTNADVQISIGRGARGAHPYTVRLVKDSGVSPEHVLSEGEATCVGLAGFFAELQASGNQSGVVLDDPVSSLDHNYKSAVARFVVQEAATRQVVVLTHDVTFLWLLRKNASETKVLISESTLNRGHRWHGVQNPGPPFIAMNVKHRLKWLRDELLTSKEKLENEDRQGYERHAEFIYLRLRKTWERAVEEILLNNVVERFGPAVHTLPLAKIIDINEDDIKLLTQQMSRCSSFAHDQPGVFHEAIPDPATIEADITELAKWVRGINKRRN